MVANSFVFSFKVPLPASADRAYRWATDYRPDDPAILGQDGVRAIEKIARDTLLLTDTVKEGRRTVQKVRLVRLRPKERSWTNTHLKGPYRHSQFLYRIVPVGRTRSRLEYVGLQVEYGPKLSARELARRAEEVRRDDRKSWTGIVRAMKADLARRR
jgi:hypothetical protein